MEHKHNKGLVRFAKYLRLNMTKEERKLWYQFLRFYEIKFVRQKPIGNYIVDFYCGKAKLVVELDGSQHFSDCGILADDDRTNFLNSIGIEVVRFANLDILNNFKDVCEAIDLAVKQRLE